MTAEFELALAQLPIVAILRGLRPGEAVAVGDALARAGIRIIEVPLNSPEPLRCIRQLAAELDDRCIVGAGTVLTAEQVDEVVDGGGRLVVSPNTDVGVINRTLARGAVSMPGFATATEAFQACACGSRYLKLFPASTYGTAHMKALLAVLPREAGIFAVGGLAAADIATWLAAGARGVGIGSELYRPGDTAGTVFKKASALVAGLTTERENS